jgi:energy-coupling factor transport system permease protein
VSVRTGVTAALATRLVPVLARDAHRLADARRAVTGAPPTGAERVAVLRAVTAGALDRATDVAATLEVRGFAGAARPPRQDRPWSRHDLAFATSAVALCALAAAAGPAGWAPGVVAGAAVACALAPFADRRGIER